MRKSFAESAVLIGLMLLSIKDNSHRHSQRPFAPQLQHLGSQGSIIRTPALA
jgi:hypothetical protein